MSELQNDQETVSNRKNTLKDDPEQGLQVVASLRDQQLEKLAKKLEEKGIGKKIVDMWHQANADRSEWLERQAAYLKEVDEFIEPIYEPAMDWSSVLHLPTILTVGKTLHARMYSALLGIDPPFTVRSRTAANADRAMLVEDLLRYTIKDWCNEYTGIDDTVDRWIWDWIMRGVGIVKARWHKRFVQFEDVEIEQITDVDLVQDPETGDEVPVRVPREIEREVVRTIEAFNGPMVERKYIEDVVIIGGEGDPQKADAVIEQGWFTASELWSLVDQKIFRKDAVDKVISAGRDALIGIDETSGIKQRQIEQAGMSQLDKTYQIDRYRILEAYVKVDVFGSGITSDLIVWVHANTKEIVRATYLQRVNPEGIVPYFKADFHLRHGTEYGVGLIELLYTLSKEIDAIHNINIDIGILSSMPIGFYRPTATTLKPDGLPIVPGTLVPVDNPQTDVAFPNMGVRTAFGFQEAAALQSQIDRLTSISELNLGIIGGQGVTRTATGARALLGESSNNLNIYLQRINRPWKRLLHYLFSMLQHRLPPGLEFRIQGNDGNQYWRTVKTRQEIAGSYDFELESNSASSNKQVQVETANLLYQITNNPLDLQLGIITPANRYEAIVYNLKVNGIKDISKFTTKPANSGITFTPDELVTRILLGIDTPLDPTQDLQGFIDLVDYLQSNDELMGQFQPLQIMLLVARRNEAENLLRAMQAAQAQTMAIQQQQLNSVYAQQPANLQPVAINQPVSQGEGA